MANVDRPRGAIPVGTLSGSPWQGAVKEYAVDSSNATAIFRGDFVALEADGNIAPATVGTGNAILGVCVGVEVDRAIQATEHPGYLPATTAGTVKVCVAPDALYEVQEDGDMGVAAKGSNVAFVAGSGSTVTGVSAHELNSSSVTAATEQLRVVELVEREDNEAGTNAKWIVTINEHTFKEAAGV